MNLVYSGGFFVDEPIEKVVEKEYTFYIDILLRFAKLFDYNISITDVLNLPFCLFQDILIKGVERRKSENSNFENEVRNIKNRKTKIPEKK